MRVLHIYGQFHPDYTGDGIYYSRLISETVPYGIAHEVLAVRTFQPKTLDADANSNLRVHYIGQGTKRWGTVAVLSWVATHLRSFDVLHIHTHVDRYFLTYLLARFSGKKVIFSASLDDSPGDILDGYKRHYRWLVRLLMKVVNLFIVISPRLLSNSFRAVSQTQVKLIPQGIALNKADSDIAAATLRKSHHFASDDVLLINVGSVCERKNTRYLVEALARIKNPAVKLLVVGPILEADYGRSVNDLIVQHGLQDRVFFMGFQSDPTPFYKMSDIFVFASHAEGFPNVFLEAMVHRLPIVSSYLPGLVDFVIQYGKTGFFANSQDLFVEHITWLAEHHRERKLMGDTARDIVIRDFALPQVAKLYVDTYQAVSGTDEKPVRSASSQGFNVRLCHDVASMAANLVPISTPKTWKPLLNIVVDTESEFDWDKGIADDAGKVDSITALPRLVDVINGFGAKACFVVDYPVASQDIGAAVILDVARDGHDVGVHLQAWSSPPLAGLSDDWHSFSGNLGPGFEAVKLARHANRLKDVTGNKPTIFKAGRYGIGPNTWQTLMDQGFEIDLSVCPHFDFSHVGGPDFTLYDSHPSWTDASRRLLELPTTAGLYGYMRHLSPHLKGVYTPMGKRFRLSHALARMNALYPERLSPEGQSFSELRALTRFLYNNGLRVFTLSLHSPSLRGGNTPYTKTEADVQQMLRDIKSYLEFFRDELGGEFTTPSALLRKFRSQEN